MKLAGAPSSQRGGVGRIQVQRLRRKEAVGEYLALFPRRGSRGTTIGAPFRGRSLRSEPLPTSSRAPRRWALVPWDCVCVVRMGWGMGLVARTVPCGLEVVRWCRSGASTLSGEGGLRCNMALFGRQGVESPDLTLWPRFLHHVDLWGNSGASVASVCVQGCGMTRESEFWRGSRSGQKELLAVRNSPSRPPQVSRHTSESLLEMHLQKTTCVQGYLAHKKPHAPRTLP